MIKRRTSLAAGAALSTLLLGVSPAVTAQAVTAPSVNYYVGSDWDDSYHIDTRAYGSPSSLTAPIVIGANTTAIIDPVVDAGNDEFCHLEDATGKAIILQPGAVVAGSGARFTFVCEGNMWTNSVSTWNLIEGPGAPATLTITREALRTHTNDNHYGGSYAIQPTKTVYPGDRVWIHGDPGTWRGSGAPSLVQSVRLSLGASSIAADQVSVTSDGSVIGFSIPRRLPAGFTGNPGVGVELVSSSSTPGVVAGSTDVRTTRWSAQVSVPPRYKSSTALTLQYPTVTGSQVTKATAIVSTVGSANPQGTMTFRISGKIVGTVALTSTTKGIATLTLPRRTAGVYSVTATYSGSDRNEGSVSPIAKLTVR